MTQFEKTRSRIEDLEFIDKFVDTYASELEDIVTKPHERFSESDLEFVNKFRESRKLPEGNALFYNLFIRVGQDFRLTPDEIDALIERFFE